MKRLQKVSLEIPMSSEEESVVNSEETDYSANYCFLHFIYMYTFLKKQNVRRKNSEKFTLER